MNVWDVKKQNRSSKEIINEKDYIKHSVFDKDSTHYMTKQPLLNQIYNFLFGSEVYYGNSPVDFVNELQDCEPYNILDDIV